MEIRAAAQMAALRVTRQTGPIKHNQECNNQRATSIEDLEEEEEEEEESEKEGNVLTSTGNTKGAPTLTATRTSSNGDSNVGGLRRSTRAASKTPADPNISKGATVPTPDPTEH
ncbi:hypothetical protein H4Q26_005532, partial [Puccinia striiformis f. sp. tritici PST-130]